MNLSVHERAMILRGLVEVRDKKLAQAIEQVNIDELIKKVQKEE